MERSYRIYRRKCPHHRHVRYDWTNEKGTVANLIEVRGNADRGDQLDWNGAWREENSAPVGPASRAGPTRHRLTRPLTLEPPPGTVSPHPAPPPGVGLLTALSGDLYNRMQAHRAPPPVTPAGRCRGSRPTPGLPSGRTP